MSSSSLCPNVPFSSFLPLFLPHGIRTDVIYLIQSTKDDKTQNYDGENETKGSSDCERQKDARMKMCLSGLWSSRAVFISVLLKSPESLKQRTREPCGSREHSEESSLAHLTCSHGIQWGWKTFDKSLLSVWDMSKSKFYGLWETSSILCTIPVSRTITWQFMRRKNHAW